MLKEKMDGYSNGSKEAKEDIHLTEKLTQLEQQMKYLQQSLLDEKLKLNRERIGQGDELPDNWESMNRLHLPQCPLAKVVRSSVKKPICPIHGHTFGDNGLNSRSLPRLHSNQAISDSRQPESDHYSQLIKENYIRLDSVNEKFRDLYDSSMFSPTFYQPRIRSKENSLGDKDSDRRLYNVSSRVSSVGKNKNYDSSLEDLSVTRNSSHTNTESRSGRSSDANLKGDVLLSESMSGEVFNPFIAIENVRKKFMDFENFVQEAYVKSKGNDI